MKRTSIRTTALTNIRPMKRDQRPFAEKLKDWARELEEGKNDRTEIRARKESGMIIFGTVHVSAQRTVALNVRVGFEADRGLCEAYWERTTSPAGTVRFTYSIQDLSDRFGIGLGALTSRVRAAGYVLLGSMPCRACGRARILCTRMDFEVASSTIGCRACTLPRALAFAEKLAETYAEMGDRRMQSRQERHVRLIQEQIAALPPSHT